MNQDPYSLVGPMESFEDSPESSALDELSREPGSFLERFLDYVDAEAIQTLFTSMLENLIEAFKGAFQEYLDIVQTEPEAFSDTLQQPLKEIPAIEKSETEELIRENFPVTDISLSQNENAPETVETPKMERTVLTEHTVAQDEMLSSLALRYYGRADMWPLIHEANLDTIGADPGRIYPGQELIIPAQESSFEPPTLVLSTDTPPLVLKPEGLYQTADNNPAPETHDSPSASGTDGVEADTAQTASLESQAAEPVPEESSETASVVVESQPETTGSTPENQVVLSNLDAEIAIQSDNLADANNELMGLPETQESGEGSFSFDPEDLDPQLMQHARFAIPSNGMPLDLDNLALEAIPSNPPISSGAIPSNPPIGSGAIPSNPPISSGAIPSNPPTSSGAIPSNDPVMAIPSNNMPNGTQLPVIPLDLESSFPQGPPMVIGPSGMEPFASGDASIGSAGIDLADSSSEDPFSFLTDAGEVISDASEFIADTTLDAMDDAVGAVSGWIGW